MNRCIASPRLLRLLTVLAVIAGGTAARAQTPAAQDAATKAAIAQLEARVAELEKERLQAQTPARLAALEETLVATPAPPAPDVAPAESMRPIRDPAVTTVEEQTRQNGSPSLGEAIRERVRRIQDPAIITVNQQTGPTGGSQNWFDRLSLRGYAQFRWNEIPWYDPNGAPPFTSSDGSVALNQNFYIRRARLILSGDVSDHMYVYIQPDFAGLLPNSPDAIYYTQLRDCFCDVYLDTEKVHRLRIGQSKVPYGWENLQSSSNRIPLDRSDGLLSANQRDLGSDRDLGVFYYYTPDFAQDLFKFVLDNGLKGSGNYGLLGFGFYNGQGASFREQNENIHMALRLAVPMQFNNGQVVELGAQAYTGNYSVLTAPIQPLGVAPAKAPSVIGNGYLDDRVAGTFVYYPQPFGFQAEWNVGRGPVLNDAQTAVIDAPITGGYAMTMYRCETATMGTLFPFVRYQYYNGGSKSEYNAPHALVNEWDSGVEWQINPQMELTMEYTFANRTNTVPFLTGESYRQFVGDVIRIQFQMNY